MCAVRPRRPERGVSLIEILIVVAIGALVAVFVAAYLRSIFKREKLKTAVKDVYAVVVATRMQAIRRNQTCVMLVDTNRRQIRVWAETPPENYVQDPGEPTLIQAELPANVVLRFAPAGAAVNGPDAVAFDGYLGSAELADRIVFKGDGSLDPPQAANSQRPARPGAYTAAVPAGSVNCNPGQHCRGIYISDNDLTGDVANRNTFRISVDDLSTGSGPTMLKWVPSVSGGNPGEIDYVPPPWKWVD